MFHCPNCNTTVPDEALTCGGCGVLLRGTNALTAVPAKQRMIIAPAPVVSELSSPIPDGSNSRSFARFGYAAVAILIVSVLGGLLYRGVEQARDASRRTTTRCRLKILGSSTYNFEATHKHMPPRNLPSLTKSPSVTVAADEVPQSFFTDILPYIGQPELYGQLNSRLPWTNAANKPVFSTIISTYMDPRVPNPPRNEDGNAIAHVATNSKCICDTKTITLTEITDGTSNTMLLATVNAGFQAWGDPTNYRDPSKGFSGGPDTFGPIGRDAFVQVLLFDGSVRSVAVTTPLDICTKLGDPRDGQPMGDF